MILYLDLKKWSRLVSEPTGSITNNGELEMFGRTHASMLRSLYRQYKFLKADRIELTDKGDYDFSIRASGVLRILLYSGNSNKPLLINLLKDYPLTYPIICPVSGSPIELDRWLHTPYLECTDNTDGSKINLSYMDVIVCLAHKLGGAHEDSAIDEKTYRIISGINPADGRPSHVGAVENVCKIVIGICEEVLQKSYHIWGTTSAEIIGR